MSYLIILALIFAALVSLLRPWVGIVAIYFIALLNPQSIWFWAFENTRLVLWVSVCTLFGVIVSAAKGVLNFQAIMNIRSVCLLTLLLTCAISAVFAPYSGGDSNRFIGSSVFILEMLFKIILMVFVSSIVVKDTKELKAATFAVLLAGVYLTWWVNDQYVFGPPRQRYPGPISLSGSGIYSDENVFAAFFVVFVPYAIQFALGTDRKLMRYGMIVLIPFAWHGIFLTGSRGGMLALGVGALLTAYRTKSRVMGGVLVLALVGAFVWQGGSVIKERMTTIDDYQEDASASDRINAWAAATEMIARHPFTGVGPGAFVRAFPVFSNDRPAQAHNTFFQFAGEFGVLAGCAYVVLLLSCIYSLWRVGNQLKIAGPQSRELTMLVEATLVALVSCAVCSIFLSLQLFEPMYFLVFVTNSATYLATKVLKEQAEIPEKTPSVIGTTNSKQPVIKSQHKTLGVKCQ